MKYNNTSSIYSASNVYYDTKAEKAYSYKHWCFVKRIGGKLVFNNHGYSVTTKSHQSKVRGLLASLGVNIDVEVDTRLSLDDDGALRHGLDSIDSKVQELVACISKPRTNLAKNITRKIAIDALYNDRAIIVSMLKGE